MENRITFKSILKRLLVLAGPIVIGQLGVVLVSFADTFMVGHYGVKELAAASFVNNLTMLLVVTGLGFSLGLTPLVSEAEGRADRKLAGALLRNGLKSNAVLAALVFIVMVVLYLNLDNMGQPEELLPLIKPYYIVVSVSILCTYFFNAFKQFTDGLTKTKVSMTVIIASNVMNIVGNYVLIYGKAGFPEMGLLGAGISTLAARIFTVAAMAGYVFFNKRMKEYVAGFRSKAESRGLLGKVTRLGIPIGLQMGMETASFSLVVILVGKLGTTELAAHQVMVTISQICYMLYIAVASASAIMISSFNGRKMFREISLTSRAAYVSVLGLTVICAGSVILFLRPLSSLFTESDIVTDMVATIALPFLLYQFGDGLQIAYANALRGLQKVKPILPIAFVSYFIISIPASYVFAFPLGMELPGIWYGFPISLTFAGIFYYLTYRKAYIKLACNHDNH
ncbi:MAG: MATE family efflux transporter [Bacteroidetes bacterium]|uniref:Multidrug-efflux transporter n=1 Tax=Candidatus Merdivivens pullistercoris TaxID=2840873 RepID=A0A9D9I4S7_9BACT|nr:MATE family efflux transporter [Candidatus Merdivivens pullistercoris]